MLPCEFKNYVKTLKFPVDSLLKDVCFAQFTGENRSVEIEYGLGDYFLHHGGGVDSFSVSLTNYASKSYVFFYFDKLYSNFYPVKIDVDSLSADTINEIVLKYTIGHDIKWKYLTRNLPTIGYTIPEIKSECLTVNEYGKRIDFNNEKQKLKTRILKKEAISYTDACRMLLKSGYFNKKKYSIIQNDSLPPESKVIFNLLQTFTLNALVDIYNSYYDAGNSMFESEKSQQHTSGKKSQTDFYISKAGFNKDKTICFLPIQQTNEMSNRKTILIFERRLNEFVLTGKVAEGKYYDALEGNECEYYPDMRNYRLFY